MCDHAGGVKPTHYEVKQRMMPEPFFPLSHANAGSTALLYPFPLSTPNVPCAFLQQILPTFLSHEAYGVTNLLQVKFILRDELKIVIQVPLKISVQLITKLKIVFCH